MHNAFLVNGRHVLITKCVLMMMYTWTLACSSLIDDSNMYYLLVFPFFSLSPFLIILPYSLQLHTVLCAI